MRIILAIVILSLIVILSQKNTYNPLNHEDNYFTCQKKSLHGCSVPTLNNQQCFLSKYYKCPHLNGSYQQCTNNYWSYDGICDCSNRAFELCPKLYKISDKCYQERMKECPKLTLKERGIKHMSCKNPRINMYHGDKYKKFISNNYVFY